MSLTTYRRKRRFNETPEPRGNSEREEEALRFVVQKHQASHLHYDFRLELDGTLKSWAIPKGPSLNPKDKRLAVMVEDHPLDYRTFEGTIPEGNYGAGTVMVWDQGHYTAPGAADPDDNRRLLREGLKNGHLSIVLSGNKLKGEFSLVKLKKRAKNEWLLIKKRDEWASDANVTEQSRSAVSERTLDDIAQQADEAPRPRKRVRGASAEGNTKASAAKLRQTPEGSMPKDVRPMLASLVAEPFDRPGWLFEIKWDGYRAIAEVNPKGVSLVSRNLLSFTHRFAPLVESLSHLGHEAVLDGEIVVVDAAGKSSFQLLQNYQKTGKGRLCYYVFDILYLDGHDLRKQPLRRRKEFLAEILGTLPDVLLSEHMEEQGIALYKAATERGLEGIVAKDGDSPYREGLRTQEWLKIKTRRRQEAVICGYTEPRGSRMHLGALILGIYDGKDLHYIGHAGGGLDEAGLSDLHGRLEPLERKTCPFAVTPHTNAAVHWVTPRLVCEVVFQEWTQDGIMRQPIFVGLREDKPAEEVHRELAQPAAEALRQKVHTRHNRRSVKMSSADPEPPLTNLSKVYWPDEGYTKGDLIDYYRTIAPVLLPYLHDRPESLNRHPDGIAGKSFFQKNVGRHPPPSWVKTASIRSESNNADITYLLCQDQAALLYLANLGCIELNPWHSRIGFLDKPDYLVIDLDPVDVPFAQAVEAAIAVRKTLERAGAESVCKTSGKRGLHICVPLGAEYDYEQARMFAELVARSVNKELPHTTSVERSPARRQGRVYLDYLQNSRGQTLAAPYSVRPFPGATVSTPLKWQEVKKGFDPTRFTIKTISRRIDKVGDLWQQVRGPATNLLDCIEHLAGK